MGDSGVILDTSPPPASAGQNVPNPGMALIPTVIDGHTTFVPASATVNAPTPQTPSTLSGQKTVIMVSNSVITSYITEKPLGSPTGNSNAPLSTTESSMPTTVKIIIGILIPLLVIVSAVLGFILFQQRCKRKFSVQEKTFGAEGERTKELPVESRRWTKAELHAKSKSIRAELHAKSRSIRAELHAKSKSIRTPAEMDGGTEAAREGVAGRYELEAKGKNRSR